MPTINVSEYVKDHLDDIKSEEEHRSYDSTIRTLVREYEGNDGE